MLVPVGSSLFMVKAKSMEHLMLDNLLENTASATQRYHLS